MEEWKDIKGYEGLYQVSNEGNVRSCERTIEYLVKGKYKAKRTFSSTILKPYLNNNDYKMVDIYNQGKKDKCTIHKLVAIAFIPNPENKPTVNHINHNRQDNRVENLEWATYPEQFDEIWKKNASEASKSRDLSYLFTNETRNKAKQSLIGHTTSEETKRKIGKANSKPIVQVKDNGEIIEWESGEQCERATNGFYKQASINKCCRGGCFSKKRNKWVNYNKHKDSKFYYKSDYEEMLAEQAN